MTRSQRILKKVSNWYFSKKVLPYWAVLIADTLIVFLAAVFIMKAFAPGAFAIYIAVLIASGLVSGILTGFIAQICLPYIKKTVSKGDLI